MTLGYMSAASVTRPSRAHRSPRVLSRCLATALVGLVVVAHVAAVRHDVSVEHVVCAEHGELVDVEITSASAPPADVARLEENAAEHSPPIRHAHCGFAAVAHGVAEGPAPSLASAAPSVQFAPQSLPPAVPPASIPALHLAPKTSPPAARSSNS